MYAVVVGDGGTAEAVVERLIGEGSDVGIVASKRAEEMAARFTRALVIRGSGSDLESLAAAGAREADTLFALADEEAVNLAACVEARQVFGVDRVVAVCVGEDNCPAFRALGVDVVVTSVLVADALLDRTAVGGQSPR